MKLLQNHFVSDVYKVLSLAQFARSHFRRNRKMSLRKMLKSKGPKIDPCGTLLSTFPYPLKE